MTPAHSIRKLGRNAAPGPRRLMAAVAALLMALPGVAHPMSLPNLLRLPLEELLRLEITASKPAPRHRMGHSPVPTLPPGGSAR